MYAIRVDSERQALLVSLSGRLTSAEAQRAVMQSASLAEAADLLAISVDVTELEQGPGNFMSIAALIGLHFKQPMRVAFVGGAYHARALQRLVRFSGVRRGIRIFGTTMAAEAWLTPVMAPGTQRLSLTEQLHLGGVDSQATTPPRGRAATPAA
jgi:hypothetical protein